MSPVHKVFLGLGANLDQPVQQLRQAMISLRAHTQLSFMACSSLYASRPMGPSDQPDYVNAVVEIHTRLDPLALLDVCQSIEQQQHRQRLRHWGPRTLDIDLLCMGIEFDHPRLKLPHPGIAQRDFVLLPWQEIAPEHEIPGLGRVSALTRHMPSFDAHTIAPCEEAHGHTC